jgi:hypothetical protein
MDQWDVRVDELIRARTKTARRLRVTVRSRRTRTVAPRSGRVRSRFGDWVESTKMW